MIIAEITINELREIDSIKLNMNDSLVDHLSKEEGVSVIIMVPIDWTFEKSV